MSLIAVGLSFWSYKETIPPVSPLKKNILASLRSLSFILVLFILFEPLLSLSYQKKEDPVVAVLIDRSESMSITDAAGNRPESVRRILSDGMWQRLGERYRVDYYGFSDGSAELNEKEKDSLTFLGAQTDIATSLESLKRKMTGKNFAAAVVISDGQYNLGVNPVSYAAAFGYPVYTIGIGDPRETRDMAIGQVVHNDVVYLNNKIPVDVSVVSFGYKGKPVSVELITEGKTVQTRYLTAAEDGAVMKASFDIRADKVGLQKFAVRVSGFKDELTDRNNARTFFVKVVKSRVRIALVSGSAGPEHLFLYKILTENPDISVQAFVEKKDGTLSDVTGAGSENPADPPDGYIFNNYPTAVSSSAVYQNYVNAVVRDKRPFLMMVGPQWDPGKYQLLKDVAPAEIRTENSAEEFAVFPSLSLTGKNSVIMKVSENPEEAVQQWQDLPPMWIGRYTAVPLEGSEVLARVDMTKAGTALRARKDIPLILSGRSGKHKSILFMSYGFWKSYFTMAGLNKNNAAYTAFFANAVKWMTAQDDTKQVIVTASKQVYRNGEKILFSGQVYDEQYNPVNDAVVRVKIKSEKGIADVEMETVGNGRYTGQLNGLEVGDYEFEGEAIRQDMSLGKDRGKLAVEDFSIELLQTGMNEKLLRNVAAESGGRFYTADDFQEIERSTDFQPLISDEKTEIDLWNKAILLFALALLLSAEWFIRKRADML